MAVKSMNDTFGPEGLVLFSLVFGEKCELYTKAEAKKMRQTVE